jgi:hypothetical protein
MGLARILGAALALLKGQYAIGVDFSLEAGEKRSPR